MAYIAEAQKLLFVHHEEKDHQISPELQRCVQDPTDSIVADTRNIPSPTTVRMQLTIAKPEGGACARTRGAQALPLWRVHVEILNATSEILCGLAGHVARADIRKTATTRFAGVLRVHPTRESLRAFTMSARGAV